MKWRCPECGKPHRKNNPPCDNCGHHKLERAIVPQATRDDDYEQFLWVCPNCGRQHQRNNPPCTRCGHGKLEKQALDYGDVDPGATPSYLELVGRTEISLAAVLVVLVTAIGLGALGIIQIPGLSPEPVPTVEDVPGNETTVQSLSIDEIEGQLIASFDAERTTALERREGLDSVARFVNRQRVKNAYTDEDREITQEQLRQFDIQCSGRVSFFTRSTADPVGPETTVSDAASMVQSSLPASTGVADSTVALGLHLHAAPDDRVYATVFVCEN